MKRLTSFCLGIVLFVGSLASLAPLAVADQTLGNGIRFTWNDNEMQVPEEDSCRNYRITWYNETGALLEILKINLEDGNTSVVWELDVEAGSSGNGDFRLCNVPGNPPIPIGPLKLIVEYRTDWLAPEVIFSIEIPLIAPIAQAPISMSQLPCPPDLSATRFCSNPWIIQLNEGENWAFGDAATPVFRLYGRSSKKSKNGKRAKPMSVPFQDETNSHTDVWPPRTVILRPEQGALRPGRYLITTTNGTRGQWRCSIYYADGCYWSDASASTKAFTFRWTGQEIRNIRYVDPSDIPKVRL